MAIPCFLALDVPRVRWMKCLASSSRCGSGDGSEVPVAELGLEEAQEGAEGAFDAAVGVAVSRMRWRGGILWVSDLFEQSVALLLVGVAVGGFSGAVGFVHNHQIRTGLEKEVLVAVGLYPIHADDLDGIVLVDGLAGGLAALELADGAGAEDGGVEVKLFAKLFFPLVAEVGGRGRRGGGFRRDRKARGR